jgi:transcriptional regulator of nitric oxide reductase
VGRISVEVVGEDLMALSETAVVKAWRRTQRVGEVSVVDPMAVVEAMAVQAWRQSRSRHGGGREIKVVRIRV